MGGIEPPPSRLGALPLSYIGGGLDGNIAGYSSGCSTGAKWRTKLLMSQSFTGSNYLVKEPITFEELFLQNLSNLIQRHVVIRRIGSRTVGVVMLWVGPENKVRHICRPIPRPTNSRNRALVYQIGNHTQFLGFLAHRYESLVYTITLISSGSPLSASLELLLSAPSLELEAPYTSSSSSSVGSSASLGRSTASGNCMISRALPRARRPRTAASTATWPRARASMVALKDVKLG
ncbi:unnamed protein product [Phytophthora lilii]|uniref:Unnamed protein product n=1 Tax=Phytophthora lilii TaxID=2077276 RepID=A0A9W6THF2_9STRA|nr:unnamed protein product [Phytophthora lilii]